jgi:hypothetical protein
MRERHREGVAVLVATLLVRREGRWFIAAATNELVTAARPVPPELKDGR